MNKVSYVSRKILEAERMSYGEFEEHAETAQGEYDVDAPGYLIQVDEDTFKWVDAETFEEENLVVGELDGLEPYQKRLMVERAILLDNFTKLSRAFNKNTFLALPFLDRELLEKQHRAMEATLRVLNERVSKFLH